MMSNKREFLDGKECMEDTRKKDANRFRAILLNPTKLFL